MISSRRTIFLALSLWCLFFTVASAKNNDSEYLDNETSVGDDMENERSIEGNRKLRKPQRTPEQLSKMFQVYTNWFFAIGDHQNLYFFNLNISSNDGRYNLVGNISLHDLYVMYMGGRDDSTKFTKLGNTEEKSTIVVLESLTGVLYLFKHLQVALCKVYKLTGVIDFVIRGDYIYYITGHSANNKLTLYRSRHAFDQYETTVFDTIMLTSTFVDDVSTSKVAVSADGTKRAIAYFVANKLCVLINSDEVNKRNITIARDRAVLFASRTHMYTFKLKNNYNVTGTDSGFIDRTCLPKDFSYSRNDGIVGSLICGDRLYDYEANVTESNTIYLELVPRPEDVVVRTKLDMPDSTLLSVSLTIDSPCDDSNTGNKDLTFRMNHTYSAAATPLVTKHRIFGNIVCDIRASNLLFQYELLRTSEYYMDMNPSNRKKNTIAQFKPPRRNSFLDRAQQQMSTLTRSGNTPDATIVPSPEDESSDSESTVKSQFDITVYTLIGFSVGVFLLSIVVLIVQFYILSIIKRHISILRAEKSHLTYPLV